METNDWTDTNWTHALGTERLTVVGNALAAFDHPLAQGMSREADADLKARSAWREDDTSGEPWWPLTDLEREAYNNPGEED